jgi:glycosyltransferase involved in cell wall biosynthesis
VAISRAQRASAPDVPIAAVVTNPIAVDRWPFQAVKDDYLLWIGRMDPTKGPHRAIEVARLAGRRLVLAGPVQPGQEEYFKTCVEPHLDGEQVIYAGEVAGEARSRLFARATAMLMPIRWDEPFGMVMVEALACGTPVVAFAEGAARDIVLHGVNGLLVRDEHEMAEAVERVRDIDPAACRQSVTDRFDAGVTARGYEAVYQAVAGRQAPAGGGRRSPGGTSGTHRPRSRSRQPGRRLLYVLERLVVESAGVVGLRRGPAPARSASRIRPL